MLRSFAQAANPGGFRLAPWTYTQMVSLAFPSAGFPTNYFAAGGWVQRLLSILMALGAGRRIPWACSTWAGEAKMHVGGVQWLRLQCCMCF